MGSSIKKMASSALRCALACVLALGLMPALAPDVACASQDAVPTVSGTGDFGSGTTGQAETTVSLVARNFASEDAELKIGDYLAVATQVDLSNGIWVQVLGGTAPYSAKWHSVEVDASGQTVPGSERDDWGAGTYDSETQTFTLKVGGSELKPDTKYHFWCEVSDSASPAATVNADGTKFTEVINSTDYWAGPITWTPDGGATWAWSAEGGLVSDDGTPNGVDGKILKKAELSASAVNSTSISNMLANAASKEDAKVEGSYNVAIVTLEDAPDKDVFLGMLLMKVDVTDIVSAGTLPEDLGLLWLNPYEAGGKVVDLASAPYGAKPITSSDGRTYIQFSFPSDQAGPTGMLGSFAVTTPVPKAEMFNITMAATEGGLVDPLGTIKRAKGEQPSFTLYQEFGYIIDSVVAIDASGNEVPADGALEGNIFTLAPLSADVSLLAKFKKVEVPVPGGDEASRTIDLEVGSADSDKASSVSIVGYDSEVRAGSSKAGIKVDASRPVTLMFNTARGYAVDKVVVTFKSDGDGVAAGDSSTYSPEGAYLELPVLAADAKIQVSYKPIVLPPVIIDHKVSVRAIPERAAVVAVSSNTAGADDAVTFSAKPKIGWQLVSAKVVYTVVPEGGTSAQEVEGRTYTADELSSGSMTLYGIYADTRVDFTFEMLSKDVEFPPAGSISGADLSLSGTQKVDADDPLRFTVTVDAGYKLPPAGVMLEGSQGEKAIGWTGTPVKNADGTTTYEFNLTYADVAGLGDGVKLDCMPVKEPSGPGSEVKAEYTVTTSAGPGGSITATTTKPAGESITIWLFPEDGYKLGEVLVDGKPVSEFSSADERLFDHTKDEKPCVTIMPLGADHTVSASFVEASGTVNPPSVVIKPDPGDGDDPDDPNKPPVNPGDSNLGGETPVYKGESQSFTYKAHAGFELDGVKVDGEYIYFDGAHLKDDPTFADHKLFAWDEESGRYVFKDEDGETVGFDVETGTLTFYNVQKPHTYMFVETAVLDVIVNVDVIGGTVHANGAVEGSSKAFVWKSRKGLTIYMIPDVAGGYRLGDVLLDGTPVSSDEIKEVSRDQMNTQGTPPLSSLVKSVTFATEAYAVDGQAYAYTIPTSYLIAKEPGSVVTVSVPFVKKSSGDDNQGGNEGGNNPGGNKPGGDNQGGNQGGNGNDGQGGNQGGNGNDGQGGNGSGNQGNNGGNDGNGSNSGAPSISNGFNGSSQGDGSAQNTDGTYTIKAAVKSGKGVLDCPADQKVRPGANCTVAFKPAVGYQVSALNIDGKRYAYTNRTFTFQNVQAGHTVQVEFSPVGYAGDNSQLNRGIKTLQTLAKTGDLNAPAATTLLAVAFGASGIAFLVWSRRKKEDDDAMIVEQTE